MSKVKYPDKEKIRIQIDEILDKSELFDATEDKSSTYTNDKIVQLKPVKQPLPVGNGYTYSVRTDNVATRNNVVLYIDVPYDIKYIDKQLDGMDEAAADTLKQVIQTYIDKNGLNSNIKISCYIMNNSLEFYSGDTVYGSLTLSTE